jgi:hypothetical protein
MTEDLIALLGGREIGRIHREAKGRLSFTCDRALREADEAYQRLHEFAFSQCDGSGRDIPHAVNSWLIRRIGGGQ